MKELAERLAKAMPERFVWFEQDDYWQLTSRRWTLWAESSIDFWWAVIGPLMDELEVLPCLVLEKAYNSYWNDWSDVGLVEDTWLLSCFHAVVEAAEARK